MQSLIEQYPEILAILIVVLGAIAARLFSGWSVSLARLITAALSQFDFAPENLEPKFEQLIRRCAFFAVLVIFLLLALRTLDIGTLAIIIDVVISFVPRLLVAAAIILGGYLLGMLAKEVIANMSDTASESIMPSLAQYLIIIIAVVTGLEQLAIEITFLATFLLVILAALLGSLSLAFALGSKDLVANMLMRRELDRYAIGDTLTVDGHSGQITEISGSGLVITTEEGNVVIPATRLATAMVVHKVESD